MNNSTEVWLWLLLVMQPYNPKTNLILETYEFDAANAAKAIRDGQISFLSDEEIQRAKTVRNGDVHALMKLCYDNNIRIITLDDEEYPDALRNIYNPPIVLFAAGSLANLDNEFSISVIGARQASKYAYQVTDYLVAPLTRIGTVIVSGLANGIDSAAHNACLNNGGKTIGVCACGILTDYPKGSGILKRRIVENGGAIISELLPFDKTSGGYFKFRNRIISGLTYGTLVIEAAKQSGCFLTVAHALEQGKEVFAVPPCNILNSFYCGTADLLRDGATPVFDYKDILYAFYKDGLFDRLLNDN